MKTTFFLKTAVLPCLLAIATILPAAESGAQSKIGKRDTGRTTIVPKSNALVKPGKAAGKTNGGLFKKSDKREPKAIPQVTNPTDQSHKQLSPEK